MDLFNYYSIDAILAENQRIQCKFKQKIPDMGYLGSGLGRDILPNTKLQMPVWLSYIILYSDWADLVIPVSFTPRVRNALKAEPRSVQLSGLVGAGVSWYAIGRMMMDIIQGRRAQVLSEMMTESFKARLMEIADQAHHFGSTDPMPGASFSGAAVHAFREGLDTTERELFMLARNSAKASREWYDSNNPVRKPRDS